LLNFDQNLLRKKSSIDETLVHPIELEGTIEAQSANSSRQDILQQPEQTLAAPKSTLWRKIRSKQQQSTSKSSSIPEVSMKNKKNKQGDLFSLFE
jgi:hypothetical protein